MLLCLKKPFAAIIEDSAGKLRQIIAPHDTLNAPPVITGEHDRHRSTTSRAVIANAEGSAAGQAGEAGADRGEPGRAGRGQVNISDRADQLNHATARTGCQRFPVSIEAGADNDQAAAGRASIL